MRSMHIRLAPWERGIAHQVIMAPIQFQTSPYAHVVLGNEKGTLTRIPLSNVLSQSLRAGELGPVSVTEQGGACTLIPEVAPDERLLALIDVSGGSNNAVPMKGAATLYTAATWKMLPCRQRGKAVPNGTVRCQQCGAMAQYQATNWFIHPQSGEERQWDLFALVEGVTVVAEGAACPARGAGDSYRVMLAILDKDVRFRVQRNGYIEKGEPREVFVCWNGTDALVGYDASFAPPPAEERLSTATVL